MAIRTWTLILALFVPALSFRADPCVAQELSPKWDELTAPDFPKAVEKAGGVCVLPFGSIEKFGPAGPLGTNLYVMRIVALEAVKQEYAVVIPESGSSPAESALSRCEQTTDGYGRRIPMCVS